MGHIIKLSSLKKKNQLKLPMSNSYAENYLHRLNDTRSYLKRKCKCWLCTKTSKSYQEYQFLGFILLGTKEISIHFMHTYTIFALTSVSIWGQNPALQIKLYTYRVVMFSFLSTFCNKRSQQGMSSCQVFLILIPTCRPFVLPLFTKKAHRCKEEPPN